MKSKFYLFALIILGAFLINGCDDSSQDVDDTTTEDTSGGDSGSDKKKNYTVTFDTDGGSYIAPIEVKAGAAAVRPEDPTLDGLFFVDWYNSEKRLTRWDFTTPIEEDITIYAQWSKDDPFDTSGYDLCIFTKSDLMEFRTIVNNEDRNVKGILMSNIDMSGEQWSPIGIDESTSFNGVFNGNGYTISNLTISQDSALEGDELASNQGLFGYINQGKVLNLRLKDPMIMGGCYTGAVCAHITGRGTIENCGVVGGSIVGYVHTGGVVGFMTTEGGVVKGCYNEATVKATGGVGGIVGEACGYTCKSTKQGSISNCYNRGDVSGSNHVGGIIADADCVDIVSCCNSGKITGENIVGGIVAELGTKYREATLSDESADISTSIIACYNSGDISGADEVGGIAGILEARATSWAGFDAIERNMTITVTACYNTGNITTTKDENYDYTGCGGVVGLTEVYAYSTSHQNISKSSSYASITVNACYNTGEIAHSVGCNVGGIIGKESKTERTSSSYTKEYSKAVINTSSSSYVPYATSIYTNEIGTQDPDLETALKSPGYASTLNYRAGSSYWVADSNGINDNFPILASVDYQ